VCENHWPFLKPLLVGFKTFIFFVLFRITCTLDKWKNDPSSVTDVEPKSFMSCSELNHVVVRLFFGYEVLLLVHTHYVTIILY